MQQRRKIRYLIAFVLLTAGILVLLLCNIGIGTVKIPLTEIPVSYTHLTLPTKRIV